MPKSQSHHPQNYYNNKIKSTHLREVREVAVGKHGRVAQQLVADVGLRRVERAGVVADVLWEFGFWGVCVVLVRVPKMMASIR